MEQNKNQHFQICENFIHPIQQQELEKYIYYNSDIPWSYQHNFERADESISVEFRKNDENIMKPSCGIFYHNMVEDNRIRTDHYKTFSILRTAITSKFKLEVNSLLRMRINLSMPYFNNTDKYTSPHYDYPSPNVKTVIYYVTGDEGDTVLFDESYLSERDVQKKTVMARVSPKKGKAILFNSNRYHAACMPNKNIRSVVNIIFE
jgi:hypothetical protein